MARKIQILLPDGIAKRTIIAGVDAGMKWGHGLYLEIFTRGLIEFEKVAKQQRQTMPPVPAAKPKSKKEKKSHEPE